MIDFSKIKTIPISQRMNKFCIADLIPLDKKSTFKSPELDELSEKIAKARKEKRQVILMMGAHVIKVGCSRFIIELMKKGVITHIAMNGAGSIHDFEIALIGATSEDVATNIEDGTFGMSEETGRIVNGAVKEGTAHNKGYGISIGKKIAELNLEYKEYSICYWAYKLSIPLTVHAAIGTDIIYQHPSCDGAAIGKASYEDFKIFADSVSRLNEGVLLNVGSAVILPEVFLKALTVARNLGHKVERFSAANLDMEKHYRPTVNVVERPTSLGGKGYQVKGRHEDTIPYLYKKIEEGLR